jgi:hypothetical protein
VALGQVILRFLRVFPVNVISPGFIRIYYVGDEHHARWWRQLGAQSYPIDMNNTNKDQTPREGVFRQQEIPRYGASSTQNNVVGFSRAIKLFFFIPSTYKNCIIETCLLSLHVPMSSCWLVDQHRASENHRYEKALCGYNVTCFKNKCHTSAHREVKKTGQVQVFTPKR